jgi:hypothetical protein
MPQYDESDKHSCETNEFHKSKSFEFQISSYKILMLSILVFLDMRDF